jgi:hypothetical protein
MQSVQIEPEGSGPPTLTRPAGIFMLLGFDGTTMSGQLTFAPNSQFIAAHAALGAQLTSESALALALSGAAIGDYQTVRSHFPDASVSDVAMIGMFGQTANDAVALKQLLPTSTAAHLRGFLLRHITPAYVRSLRDAGLQDLTPEDVKALREAHVTAAIVRRKTAAGERPSSSRLLGRTDAETVLYVR